MTNQRFHQTDNILYRFSLRFVGILTALLTGLFLISGLLLTCYSTDMEVQLVLTKWDNPLLCIPGTVLLCLFFGGVVQLISQESVSRKSIFKKNVPIMHCLLRFIVLGWCLFTGIVLILFSKSVPAGDGYSVYAIAESLAAGDTSVIHPTDSYLSYYPQQVGLAAFWEILIRIWKLTHINLPAYHFIKLVYLLLECILILFQEKIVRLLWRDEKAECLYLLLAGANCPLLFYTSFIYGEIPSFAAVTVSFYFLTRLFLSEKSTLSKSASLRLSLGGFFFLTLSVLLRKNSLIFVIAAVLVMLLWGMRQKRPFLILLAILCTAGALAVLPGVQKYYENRSGSTLSSGVPAMSYFAMGMQESSRADGWYNGFNFLTYQDTGMGTEATVQISLDAIHERVEYFRAHPQYALSFYARKYLSQWADGTYACRQATLATFGGRSPSFVSLYEGDSSRYLIFYCNLYQNVLYLGSFCFCFAALRRRKRSGRNNAGDSEIADAETELPVYLGLISVVGGFLFHMIWEANARYIFLYGLMLLPYAARGLSVLTDAAAPLYTGKTNFQ